MLMPLKRFLFFNPEDVDYESTTPANQRSKPLKTVARSTPNNTGLKPGENEMKDILG
jgi:hypothetical protein